MKFNKALTTGLLVLFGAATACSFIVDTNNAQCKTTADCIALGPAFEKLVCSPAGVCVGQGGCSTNADCIDANGGKPFICKKDGSRKCVSLELTSEAGQTSCSPWVEGPEVIRNDETVWLGVMGVSDPKYTFMPHLNNMSEFARREINKNNGGLPPAAAGGNKRPIGFVYCDNFYNVATGVEQAKYLAEEVGVPAVLGPQEPEIAIAAFSQVFSQKKVMMLAPIFGETAMVDTGNPRLFWSSFPAALIGGPALASFIQVFQPYARTKLAVPEGTGLKIAFISSDSQSWSAAAQAFLQGFQFNGKGTAANQADGNYLEIKYPANGVPADYVPLQNQLVAFQPHIVIQIGGPELAANVVVPVEQQWTKSEYRPYWLTSAGGVSADLFMAFNTPANLASGLARRVTYNTYDWMSDDNLRLITSYQAEPSWKALVDVSPVDIINFGFVTMGYDNMYAMAYLIAANGSNPLTGDNLAKAMPKLMPPNALKVKSGTGDLVKGFQALAPGGVGAFDFHGQLTNFDLDPAIGYQGKWPMLMVCPKAGADGVYTAVKPSGITFNMDTLTAVGNYDQCN